MEHLNRKISTSFSTRIQSKFEHPVDFFSFLFSLIHRVEFVVPEVWKFQLFDHVFTDRSEVETNVNGALTQTAIEIRLYKQQPKLNWPQIHSYNSLPITPNRDEQTWHDCQDVNMIEQGEGEISIKRLNTNFNETNERFTLTIYIKQVQHCRASFTETNFTVNFQTK